MVLRIYNSFEDNHGSTAGTDWPHPSGLLYNRAFGTKPCAEDVEDGRFTSIRDRWRKAGPQIRTLQAK